MKFKKFKPSLSLLVPAGLGKLKSPRVRLDRGRKATKTGGGLYCWTDFALPLWQILSRFLFLSLSLSAQPTGPAKQKPDAIKRHHWKIQLVSGAGHRNESTAWCLFCPTPQHHISQLKPFHGHRSRGNWKSMADWLRPLVINFPSLAGLRDQHPHLCCAIALVSPWRVVDQGVEVTVVLSSC